MYIEQMYTNCLAEAAYYIESDGEVAIIDPIRDTAPYIAKAKERNAKIKYVFETHFHADFVSGHIDLAKESGATIIYGPKAETSYQSYIAKDNEEFQVGRIKIKVLHTPGHTPESSCYLLIDENGKEHAVFTGDTLFVGDVGRPDLLDGKMSKEELAGMLYDSLNYKLKTLPDQVIVYPAHGPGSACGKNIGKDTWSTIGEQKQSNYAMKDMDKADFINVVTAGLLPPPQYFFKDAMINKKGYESLDKVMNSNLASLTPGDVEKEIQQGALVLDTRNPETFEKGFIPGAMNIGLNGSFAVWVGTLVDISTPLIIVSDEGKEEESILRLARVGFENVKGFLKGGINSWTASGKPVNTIHSITSEEFAKQYTDAKYKVLDVRKTGEYENGHVKNAIHSCLDYLPKNIDSLDKNQAYLVHCAAGYRSMIACSIMQAKGFRNVVNVLGGYNKIKETTAETVSLVS